MTDLSCFEKHADLLCCPACGGDLQAALTSISCQSCRRAYPVIDGIPNLFWMNEWRSEAPDVTQTVKQFYETNPFPNYDELDDAASLIRKSRDGIFAKLLDEQIPYETTVFDCGCGTGQLSNFLSIAQRTVFGADMSSGSLRLAQQFKEKNSLSRVCFLQMNIFAPVFKSATFDVVISNGVLHHTSDPFLAYQTLAKLVKPGGHILLGLYHKFGRIVTDLRRVIFRASGGRFQSLDPRLVDSRITKAKREAWFADQYRHPHESKHTIGEVLRWFQSTGLEFVKSIPKSRLGSSFKVDEQLFEPEKPGNSVQRFIAESQLLFRGSREGGFFVMIGRKPSVSG